MSMKKKFDFVKWIKAAGIRALRTVAQTAVGVIGSSAVIGDVNWAVVASASALAGIISLLMSIGGLPELDEEADVPDTNVGKNAATKEYEPVKPGGGNDNA